MWIGFAHIFQIVDLRFCHDGPMIIDAFKAIKRRRLFIRSPIPCPARHLLTPRLGPLAPHFGHIVAVVQKSLDRLHEFCSHYFSACQMTFAFVRAGEIAAESRSLPFA
jgi:hypothetical protein